MPVLPLSVEKCTELDPPAARAAFAGRADLDRRWGALLCVDAEGTNYTVLVDHLHETKTGQMSPEDFVLAGAERIVLEWPPAWPALGHLVVQPFELERWEKEQDIS